MTRLRAAPSAPAVEGFAGSLRYAQCWEDIDVARAALRLRPGDRVLAIAAAGDNVLSLLADDPAHILAVDVNPHQIAVAELKRAVLAHVNDPRQAAAFLDGHASPCRWDTYLDLRATLPPHVRAHWDGARQVIEDGVVHAGRFEQYLRAFRRYALPLAPGHGAVGALLASRDLEEQRANYARSWDSWRWRLLCRIWLSRPVLQRLGRHRALFEQAQVSQVAEHYLKRVTHALTNIPLSGNPYLAYMLTGRLGTDGQCPDYLRHDRYASIRGQLDRLEIERASLDDTLRALPSGSIDAFYLSDVFELSTPEQYVATLAEVARVGTPGARICYWNNLVEQKRPPTLAQVIDTDEALATALHAADRAFMYSRVAVETVRT